MFARRSLITLNATRYFRSSSVVLAAQIETAKDFKEKVLNSKKPVVVDFYADWCGPCKQLGPTIEDVHKNAFKDTVDFYKVNVDHEDLEEILAKEGISSIPDVRAYKGGVVSDKFVGNQPKAAVEAFFKKLA